MTESPDEQLLEQSRNGDRSAFNELVRRYQDRVYWVIRRVVRSHEESLDLTQDTFVRAYKGIDSFRGDAQFFTWLYRIATNLSFNHLRAKRLRNVFSLDREHDTLPSDDPTASDQVERNELREIIERAIDTLPKKQKAVFLLRYYEELPYEEIAKIMNRSVGGLKANFFHAVRKIESFVRNELKTP